MDTKNEHKYEHTNGQKQWTKKTDTKNEHKNGQKIETKQ
jgi:hypothetical protein